MPIVSLLSVVMCMSYVDSFFKLFTVTNTDDLAATCAAAFGIGDIETEKKSVEIN